VRRRWIGWILAVLVVLGAPVAWYLGSPLFISKSVDEPFPTSGTPTKLPMSEGATVPEGMTQAQVEEEMAQAAKVTAQAAEPMPGGSATALQRGTFAGRDEFHRGEGTATIYRVGQELLLRFAQFKVTNGPDLRVILTKHPAPASRAEVQEGYIEVGRLKGNIGSQNYRLPAGTDVGNYRAVVIYCQPFHVVFVVATLEAAN